MATHTESPNWVRQAGVLDLSALNLHDLADRALVVNHGLGEPLSTDYGLCMSRRLREMAEITEATADRCRENAFSEAQDVTASGEIVPCQGCPVEDAGYASTALVLLVCLFGSLAFLAFLTVGQAAMCAVHTDRPAYCEAAK